MLICLEDHATAWATLGGTDPEMGVHEIAEDDWMRVTATFGGSTIGAARWLEFHDSETGKSRATMLKTDRTQFWSRLEEDTHPFTLPDADGEGSR